MRSLMLLLSVILALIPLAGVGWILIAGSITTVDGMFMSFILLALSGIFFLNILMELRDGGLLGKGKAASAKQTTASEPD